MDGQKRDFERLVRLGDAGAAEWLVRAFERCGLGETGAWRWHAGNLESQFGFRGAARNAQGWLSLALFGIFLERYGVDTVATGRHCPRRVAGLEHLSSRCVCSGEGWLDHPRIFGRGSETPVVFTSQPYRAPEGRRWATVRNFCTRNGVVVEVMPDSESWHNPGFSRLIVFSRAEPGRLQPRAHRRATVTV